MDESSREMRCWHDSIEGSHDQMMLAQTNEQSTMYEMLKHRAVIEQVRCESLRTTLTMQKVFQKTS